jgi:transcriptional regulator with XRE-family HTH domain
VGRSVAVTVIEDFAARLVEARKQRGLTQQTLADEVGVHVSQERRYEAGASQPTLEVLAGLAVVLGVSLDWLVFGEEGRSRDRDLRHAFDDVTRMTPKERATVLVVIEAIRYQHDTRHRDTS